MNGSNLEICEFSLGKNFRNYLFEIEISILNISAGKSKGSEITWLMSYSELTGVSRTKNLITNVFGTCYEHRYHTKL